jgi:hypothetical protein
MSSTGKPDGLTTAQWRDWFVVAFKTLVGNSDSNIQRFGFAGIDLVEAEGNITNAILGAYQRLADEEQRLRFSRAAVQATHALIADGVEPEYIKYLVEVLIAVCRGELENGDSLAELNSLDAEKQRPIFSSLHELDKKIWTTRAFQDGEGDFPERWTRLLGQFQPNAQIETLLWKAIEFWPHNLTAINSAFSTMSIKYSKELSTPKNGTFDQKLEQTVNANINSYGSDLVRVINLTRGNILLRPRQFIYSLKLASDYMTSVSLAYSVSSALDNLKLEQSRDALLEALRGFVSITTGLGLAFSFDSNNVEVIPVGPKSRNWAAGKAEVLRVDDSIASQFGVLNHESAKSRLSKVLDNLSALFESPPPRFEGI